MTLGAYHPGLAHPKVPSLVDKREKQRTKERRDRDERRKVRSRSSGQCEVYELGVRCPLPARENHHLRGGIGRRNNPESVLAINRVDLCTRHHADVTGHLLFLGWTDDTNRAGTLTATRLAR